MVDYKSLNKKKKELLLKNESLTENFLVILFKQSVLEQEETFLYDTYKTYYHLLFSEMSDDISKQDIEKLKETYKETVNYDMINDVYLEYLIMTNNERKHIIYSLSRLLYIQDKYKNEEIGQKIDNKIKEWLKYTKENLKKEVETIKKAHPDKVNKILFALNFYQTIPISNYGIYCFKKQPYTEMLGNYNAITDEEFINFLNHIISKQINDSKTYEKYDHFIADFLDNLETDINMNNFKKDKMEEIKKIYDEYKEIEEYNEKKDDLLEKIFVLYHEYLKNGNEFYLQNNEDVRSWRRKAENFISHLENYPEEVPYDFFTTDYTLSYLSYNDYQKNTYRLDLETKTEEVKEKYKDISLSEDDTLDYDRKWARIDTSKVNTSIINLRESITKKIESNIDITIRAIKELEKKPKKSKEDLERLKELNETLEKQKKDEEQRKAEINEINDDIALLDKQMSEATEARQIKRLAKRRRELERNLKDKKNTIYNTGIAMQQDLFTGKYTYEKQNKRKKEIYRLMIDADYDIQNFNSEGRNFLYYVPNIPNIINELDEDFINIDIDDYLEFTGRPNGNVSRIRRNLQRTLKEMRKESYDYSFIDERGALQEGSLILIGDIKGTEYKGKASVKVQLGATFKDNLKQVFIKNQYTKVNKKVFKLGQGRNNKAEDMAKEIFIYLSKLCRIEAKKGTINGQWRKDIHLDLLITYLAEINLLNYNPNTYNRSVKEPLLNALNTGVELGLFEYKTNAFKYYDEVIATKNRGRNVKDKIYNFEKGDKYGIRMILNGDMIDLNNNQKAHETYKKHKNKQKSKQ